MTYTTYTIGDSAAVIFNWLGPVRMDAGIISPTNNTSVTDIIIAKYSGTSAERKIGKASVAEAFHNMSVTSSKWWSEMIGISFAAYSFSSGVPLRALTCISIKSRDNKPCVKVPAINKTHAINKQRYNNPRRSFRNKHKNT
jgi:hypothetical protein